MIDTLSKLNRVSLPMRRELTAVGLMLAAAIPAFLLVMHNQMRVTVMLICVASLIVLWHLNRNLAVCVNFVFLFLLGDIRRIVSMAAPVGGLDPLLVVGPLFTLYVAVPLLPKIRARDPLSRVMLVLLCVMLLEIINPRQGSFVVGLSASLFYIVPLMWFWIGRAYSNERMTELLLYRIVLPLGVLAAVLGLYQTFVGFLPWEQAWIDSALANGYYALYLGKGKIRAFGFSVNGVEFVFSMLITIVLLGAAFAAKRRAYILLLPVVAAGVFFASSRGGILKSVFGLAMIWAVNGYSTRRAHVLPRLLFALALGIGAIGLFANWAADDTTYTDGRAASSSQLATAHVVQGFTHPTNSKSSTAGIHSAMFLNGILAGFTNPVGNGLGSVTLGAGKFGGSGPNNQGTASTEVDISDAFYSMGLVGGICFVLMIFYTSRYTLEYFLYGRPVLSFALVGMFAAMLGSWIGQGQYSLAPTMCFCMGFVTRQRMLKLTAHGAGESSNRTTHSELRAGGHRLF